MRHSAATLITPSGVARSKDIILLADQRVLNDLITSFVTDGFPSGDFRFFALYLRLKSASTPTTIQFIVQFLEPTSGLWHTYNQGIFATLFYEDTEVATEIQECYEGICLGTAMRIRAVGVGTTSSATFTTSIAVGLWT